MVKAWRSIPTDVRAILAGHLNIVEAVVTGDRPPLVAYQDGSKVCVATPWKPSDMGNRDTAGSFRAGMAMARARWNAPGAAGVWSGPARLMAGALAHLKEHGWRVIVAKDARAAELACTAEREAAPKTLKVARKARGDDAALADLDDGAPTADALADLA